MSKAIADQIVETTEARRHNGQCEYGDWMPLEECPADVVEAIADEVAECMSADMRHESRTNIDSHGMVVVGGQRWVYDR